jgi:HEAT repeat protein
VEAALASLGDAGLEDVLGALANASGPRRLRMHLPSAVAAFGTKRAGEGLLECVENDADGVVRYKAIRGLGRLVGRTSVRLDRERVEHLVCVNLVEHLEILGRRTALDVGAPTAREDARMAEMTGRLLRGLLDDKLRLSFERAFRLLKIAHPREDIHRVYAASQSSDARARANAGELLDALLRHPGQERLRNLLRLVVDDLSPEQRAARSRTLVRPSPLANEQALIELLDDHDVALAALAGLEAWAVGTEPLRSAVRRVRAGRRDVETRATRWIERSDRPSERTLTNA